MNPIESQINADVERFGWHCASVSDWNPLFLYTIGLTKTYDHPEMILFGLPPDSGHSVLSTLVRNISNGTRYDSAGRYQDVLENYDVGIKRVDESHHATYLGFAMGFCRENNIEGGLTAMQLYWPDSAGVLPFEPKCDLETNQCQPRLDIPLTNSELGDIPNFE